MNFDKREWLIENNVKSGNHWILFQGDKRWDFCDIRLFDGTELGPCFQRPGDFVDILNEETVISFQDVSHVRYYVSLDLEESDETDEEEDID